MENIIALLVIVAAIPIVYESYDYMKATKKEQAK